RQPCGSWCVLGDGLRPERRLDAHDPEPVEHVVDVGEPVAHHDAPRHRRVLDIAVHVAGVDVHDLTLLRAQITQQLAGDVEGVEAAVVGAQVERVPGRPDVVHATILWLVPGHGTRVPD